MSLPPDRQPLEYYYQYIESAALQRQGFAGAWGNVRAAAESEGFTLPAGGIQAMNQLYRTAVEVRNAAEAFQRLTPDQTIGAESIATAFYARPQEERNLAPNYHIRFSATVQTGQEVSTEYLTYVMPGDVARTKDELLAGLEGYSGSYFDVFGGEVLSVGGVQILAV